MERNNNMQSWKQMTPKRKGEISEREVVVELMKMGCDIYSTIADDQGIDGIIRYSENGSLKYFDVQIKTLRDGVQSDFNGLLCLEEFRERYILFLCITHDDKKPDIHFITKKTAHLIRKSEDERFKGYLNLSKLKPDQRAQIMAAKLIQFLADSQQISRAEIEQES